MSKVFDRFDFVGNYDGSVQANPESEGEYVKAQDAIDAYMVLEGRIATLKEQLKLAGVKKDIATGHSILKTHIQNDESYAWAWQSNIACAIMDAIQKDSPKVVDELDSHKFANQTTVRIMRNLFDFDSSQLESYKAFGYNDNSDNGQTELPV